MVDTSLVKRFNMRPTTVTDINRLVFHSIFIKRKRHCSKWVMPYESFDIFIITFLSNVFLKMRHQNQKILIDKLCKLSKRKIDGNMKN